MSTTVIALGIYKPVSLILAIFLGIPQACFFRPSPILCSFFSHDIYAYFCTHSSIDQSIVVTPFSNIVDFNHAGFKQIHP